MNGGGLEGGEMFRFINDSTDLLGNFSTWLNPAATTRSAHHLSADRDTDGLNDFSPQT